MVGHFDMNDRAQWAKTAENRARSARVKMTERVKDVGLALSELESLPEFSARLSVVERQMVNRLLVELNTLAEFLRR